MQQQRVAFPLGKRNGMDPDPEIDTENRTALKSFSIFLFLLLLMLTVGYCNRQAEAHQDHDHIPPAAALYRPQLIREVRYYFGLREPVSRFGAQIHQESRFDPRAKSKAGAVGLGQIMPKTGKWLGNMYPRDLEGRNNSIDPAWNIRAMILYMKRLRMSVANFGEDAHAAALVEYNGGAGWLLRERQACAQDNNADCDPQRWFGHVENYCLRAQWACSENRAYPRAILFRWTPLYAKAGW